MIYKEIEWWSKSMDEAEDATREHQEMEVPDLTIGEFWTDPDGRIWRKVAIVHGIVGGRWCYWSPKKDSGVIVDSIFNGWTDRFAGMLRVPYDGHVSESLILVKGNTGG